MIFDYPDQRNEQRHGPSGYASYEPCRPWLRDEFDFRCVYCLKRETWGQVTGDVLVYQMCCASPAQCEGKWQYYIRELQPNGTCPIDSPPNDRCFDCLPPGTGIDLPAPVIVGGLASLGIGLLAAGLILRRRFQTTV